MGTANKNCITTHTYNKPPRTSIVGFDGSKRDWCMEHIKNDKLGQYITPSFKSNTGNLAVIQNRSFRNASNEFYGMVGLELELSFFQEWIEKITIAEHGVIAIADTNMNLLARKPALRDALGEKVNDEIVESFLSSSENYMSFSAISPLDGESRLYGARKINDMPFVIVVGEADKDWLKDWREKTFITLVIVVIFWVFSILILRNHWKQLKLREELHYLAHTDALTNISNRRDFIEKADNELKRIKRYDTTLALLVLDIDKFKTINDTHGHATGDRAIIAFTQACLESIRDVDVLGRLGGDEFAIILVNTNIEEARIATERIRIAIESCVFFNDQGERVSMTSSIGVVMVDSQVLNVNDMLAKADAALYTSKEKGRNCIEFAG
ncbi:diguanylate cyclase [Sulfurimonas sp. SAG-AH-194-C21]|nr:diguanylate cyclase [Sulfurimonas sp. SAG-AH-194-C21]MDF1884305.1 diguanylate cyclase [Sulfurimonas sp. SAG-AH-194-C21]